MRAAYAPQITPRDRLLELLAKVEATPEQIVAETQDMTFERRLERMIERDRYTGVTAA